jgi:hypothetical protein
MTGISSARSWVIVICSLIPRAYLNSYFLAKIRTNCELYFGHTNKLLRAYVAIPKDDGWNRYKQLNALVREAYPLVKACTRHTYAKYEALARGKNEETCQEYEAYSAYASNAIEVFVGLAKQPTEYVVSLIAFNRRLHTRK